VARSRYVGPQLICACCSYKLSRSISTSRRNSKRRRLNAAHELRTLDMKGRAVYVHFFRCCAVQRFFKLNKEHEPQPNLNEERRH